MTPIKEMNTEEYTQHIEQRINQLKKTSKKALVENEAYLVPPEVAKEKYGGRVGETYYLFPDEAPSQEVIDANRSVTHYGEVITFEMKLSHRRMTIMFVEGDLVIRKDREVIIRRLSENELKREILYAKENFEIDWDNAKIFIFPYKSIYFFISDSFEPEYDINSFDTNWCNPDNWFTIPFTEDFDYSEIRSKCREFAKNRPLEEDDPYSVTITMNTEKDKESEPDETLPEKPKNKGCMVVLGLILIPSLLLLLI